MLFRLGRKLSLSAIDDGEFRGCAIKIIGEEIVLREQIGDFRVSGVEHARLNEGRPGLPEKREPGWFVRRIRA